MCTYLIYVIALASINNEALSQIVITMTFMFECALAVFFLVFSFATSVTAGPFEDADAAYGTSDYWVRIAPLFPNGVPDAQHHFITEAQFRLGMHYYFGKGVPQDYVEAAKWFRFAADQGLDHAQFELGTAYEDGRGVPQSYVDAEKWFRLAAEQGLDSAQFSLGMLYSNGQGIPQNFAEAAKWFRLAADQGFDRAQFNLGILHFLGQGVSQNDAEAVKWFRLAADQGLDLAQYNLGLAYYYGRGVPKDTVAAQMWFYLAAAQGNGDARTNRDNLEKQMSPEQIAEAQKLARGRKPPKQSPQ